MQGHKKLSGTAVAIAAASLVGCASTSTNSSGYTQITTSTDMVHCYGLNICKGHNDCKSGSHSCKGQASCQGQGFVTMPSRACIEAGGHRKDDWSIELKTADLVHCYGVNDCRGKNNCRTHNNDCSGHSDCKGQGFVVTTQKSCEDIGGKAKG